MEIGQEYLKGQRNGQSCLLLTHQRMEFTSPIHKKTRGKRICCRFRREHAHVEQERPELCKGLRKSDDGCCTHRRSANKRRGNSVCQRIGLIRDSNASRRNTRQFFPSENSVKITDIPTIGPVVRNHNSSKMAGESNATRRTSYRSLSLVHRQAQLQLHLRHLHRRKPQFSHSIPHQQEVRVRVASKENGKTRRVDQQKTENTQKNDNERVRGNRCVICQNG